MKTFIKARIISCYSRHHYPGTFNYLPANQYPAVKNVLGNQSLAQELLDTMQSMSSAFFERLVVKLLVKMGYGGSIKDAGQAMGKTGDEGIDGTIKEDKLGLDIIYIQAKRWQSGNRLDNDYFEEG